MLVSRTTPVKRPRSPTADTLCVGASSPRRTASLSPDSQAFAASATRMPTAVIKAIDRAGDVTVDRGDGLTNIVMEHAATQGRLVYDRWLATLSDEDDPLVVASPDWQHPPATALQVALEAQHVVREYADLRVASFATTATPALRAWAAGPFTPVRYHHAARALLLVESRIASPLPGDMACPTIASLAPGTRICVLEATFGFGQVVSRYVYRQ